MNSPVSGMSNDALMQLLQQAKQQQQQQQSQAAQQPQHSYEPYVPASPSSPSPNNMGTLSSGAHGTDQLRDTVLYLVQQQKLRHEELVGVVKDLAHSVSSVSVDVQHIKHHGGGGGQGGSSNSKTAPQSLPPTHEDATAYQDGDVVGGEIGFAGSYAATQTLWAHTHGSPLAFQREEQLVSAMKRIESLEREAANLRLQVRSRDETIRRLTDAGLRGILNKGTSSTSNITAATVGATSPLSPSRSSVVDAYLADRWGTSSMVNDSHRVASPSTGTQQQSESLSGYPAQGAIFNSPAQSSRGGGAAARIATTTTPVSSPYTPRK